jgi:hypothetical protein
MEDSEQPTTVTLNIYDLNGKESSVLKGMNDILRPAGTGAFHAGIEVFGWEWSFGFTHERRSGVFRHEPRSNEVHSYRESVHMGMTDIPKWQFEKLMSRMSVRWPGDSYDMFHRNCCHFCAEMCRHLGVAPLPEWVGSMAEVGASLDRRAGGNAAQESTPRSLTPSRRPQSERPALTPRALQAYNYVSNHVMDMRVWGREAEQVSAILAAAKSTSHIEAVALGTRSSPSPGSLRREGAR